MDASFSIPEQKPNPLAVFRICLLGPPTISWNDKIWVIKRRSLRPLLYRGTFLQGFDLSACEEFEHWSAVERVAL
jgi:hypothetical protein